MKTIKILLRKQIRKLTILAAVTGLILLALAGCKDFSFFNELGVKSGLTINPASVSILKGGTMSFNASGGNGEYVFSIISGNNGSIVPTTGVYTAPSTVPVGGCTDIVMVTDSTNLSATATINVVSTLDELEINPKVATLSPGGSITFVATGGVTPYSFGFQTDGNKSGGSITSGGVYTAGSVTGVSDTIIVTDADSTVCAIPANVSVVAATSSVNYSVTADTFPAGADAGTALSGTFTVTNLGTGNGGKPVSWWLYLSDDGVFGGDGETLIASNSTAALNAGIGTTVTPTGTWPIAGGAYKLFAMISAEDDMTHSDNIYDAGTITLLVPDVDYRVTSITNTSDNHVGQPISGIVSVDNAGTDDGITSFTLNVYVSTNTAVDVGDTLVYSITDTGLPGDDPSPTAPSDYIYSGTWPSNPDSYYLVAEVISADDTAAGNDSDNTTAGGPYTVHYPEVDYYANAINAVDGDAGGPLDCDFTLNNGGTDASAEMVTWNLYVSSNTSLDAGDYLAASDTAGPLGATPDSTLVTPLGATWPSTPGSYYLIVEIDSAEDTAAGKTANDVTVSASTFSVTVPDVDYYAANISAAAGSAGGPLSCGFDLHNGGNDDSASMVTWYLYVSANPTLDAGDYLAASDTAGPLLAASSLPVTPSAASWPTVGGDYYLIVEVESSEDLVSGKTANDIAVSAGTYASVAPTVNYAVTAVEHHGSTEKVPGNTFDARFSYANAPTVDDGAADLSWVAYVSLDNTLGPEAILVASGNSLSPLAAGGTSGWQNFTGTWPLHYGNYHIIVAITTTDNEPDLTDNELASLPVSIGYYAESEPNDNWTALPGTDYDILVGATPPQPIVLEPGMSIFIQGTNISNTDRDDVFMFNAGTANKITFTVTWTTDADDIDLYVWREPGGFPEVIEALGYAVNSLSMSITKGTIPDEEFKFIENEDLWFNVYCHIPTGPPPPSHSEVGPYEVVISVE